MMTMTHSMVSVKMTPLLKASTGVSLIQLISIFFQFSSIGMSRRLIAITASKIRRTSNRSRYPSLMAFIMPSEIL